MLLHVILATAAFSIPDDFREQPGKYWDFNELSNPPEYRECPEPATAYKDLRPLLVKGKGSDGGGAEFFCYFAKPAGKTPEGGHPGVLLVHGGGGTAFPYNVDKWRESGFAVLAPDWYNQMPAPGLTNAVPKEPQTPRLDLPGGRYEDSNAKVVMANVANLVRAHSLLRTLPDVNPDRIVYVGLSWGSWYGATLTALDPRFCGVVEIYCGDVRPFRPYGPGGGLVAGRFLHAAKCPTWWVVGTNDDVMTPASAQTAFEECRLHYGHAIIPRLPHSHIGFEFESAMRMARHFACGGPSLPVLGRSTVKDGVVAAKIAVRGASEGRAVLNYPVDPENPGAKRWCERSNKRKWMEAPARVDGDMVSARIPTDARQVFLSLYEEHEGRFGDLCGSSDVIDIPDRANGASPVWAKGAENEMNVFIGFSSAFDVAHGERPVLRLAAGSIARVWVNGRFAGYGPARAPEGYMRIDEWPLGDFVTEGRNILAIEVSNPAINTFYLPEQGGFLFVEVVADGRTLAATGRDFKAVRLPRVQKTSRFSYQREFAEFYVVTPESYAWRTNGVAGAGLPLVEVPTPRKLGRGAPYPTFAMDGTFRPVLRTTLKRNPERVVKPLPYIDQTGTGSLKGFDRDSLSVNFSDAIQQLEKVEGRKPEAECAQGQGLRLKGLEGVVFEGARNTAGFPKIEIECISPATVWLVMDELVGPDGLPDPVRFLSCVNACGWRLERPGCYSLECFQPYGLKCAHVIVEGGEAEVRGFTVRTYLNPEAARASFRSSDPALGTIFEAAAQSLACNAVDAFTDCPGRERGAYFGDTVFTARGADVLLGDTVMERTQFENYALAPRFADVPEGLIPMLYPGDTTLGSAHWIPNFCMWSVIQLADYVRRSGDSAMAAAFRPKAEGVLAWFRKSRNAEGLLENLPGWVFVEWSDAAKFTKGVNYPTNMLYIRFLDAFAELYGKTDCRDEAERLRGTVRRLSWSGEWFRDHSLRGADGTLTTPDDCTEVCQYLAFFAGVATPARDPHLWRRIVDDMGPMRKSEAYPAVHRSNMLFGYSLRFVMLSERGLSARVLEEVKSCYLPMAEKTGTLWEGVSSDGYSCCHGFPSLAAWLIVRDALGVKEIDRISKTVKVAPDAGLPIDWCEGKIPVSDSETIGIKWRKKAGRPSVQLELPSGWKAMPPPKDRVRLH